MAQTTVTNSTAIIDEDGVILIDLLANAVDIDGDELVITSAVALHGTITINGVYTPNADFNGIDTITYTVNDSAPATVDITVNAVNDAPVVNNDTTTAYANAPFIVDVLSNDSDVDNDTLSVISATANYGSVAINIDGTLTYQVNQDINNIDVITYTVSDGNGAGTKASVEVLPALIQIRNAVLVSKSRASIDEYGVDYSNGELGKLVKFEIWVHASQLSLLNANATEILGYQFDLDWNDAEVGALNFSAIDGTNIGFNAANPENSAITFNSETGVMAIASATAIVDIDPTNDSAPSFIGAEKLIGTFYMSPIANLETISLSVKDAIVVTDAGSIESSNYSVELEVSSVNATIQTGMNSYLNNVTLHYFKDGLDTGVSTLVENGNIVFDQSIEFDVVKLSNPAAYVTGVQADDAVALLKHIVFPETDLLTPGSAAWHAADVNNNGAIQADDAVAILKHIVFPETDLIETFDLINNITGERVTFIDIDAIDVGQWTIVANGDVNISGGFGAEFVTIVPIATNDIAITDEDTQVIIDVLSNDIAPNGNVLSVTSATANNGTVTINADNTLSYTGNPDFNGVDTISYTIDDSNGGTDTATVTVTVNSVNDSPTAKNDTVITDEDTSVIINVLNNDTDPESPQPQPITVQSPSTLTTH